MGEPIHKTILVLDIEKFGRRLHLQQAEAHRMLYDVLRTVLHGTAADPAQVYTEDRGDAVFVLLDGAVPKVRIVRALLTDLPTALYDYNRFASESSRVRMRAAVHAGEVEVDDNGAVGPPLVETFRLINSDELHDALSASTAPSVLGVSDAIHREVIRHDHSGIRADHFQPLVAEGKEGPLAAWVYAPAGTAAEGTAATTPSAPAATTRGEPAATTRGEPAAATQGKPAAATPGESAAPASGEAAATAPSEPVVPEPSGSIRTRSGNFFNGAVTVRGDVVGGSKTVNGGPA